MMTDAGDVDESGKNWTMVGESVDPQTGGIVRKKSTIVRQDDNHHSMEMFHANDAGEYVKIMEINYTRA